ncbi:uncharacterized protein FTJAE_14192 [Fusarium tjaetaba]|uniref:F-box domain-containing protein n=1 Tax=Fusarium tjaetaba TaxID=1567544 RepID=A0A8H5QB80_9HYPO|nr:uncharacterized protein FTJAE_14192 [Fusarium tjaetaba]KAF5611347.1 hypothetical protein FTJAE_14192 [Fusarium tjaetaba]
MPSPTLSSLPTELITHIIDRADPSSHLNLACACSHLFKCAKKTLTHHREAHRKFSVISDLDPSTIPTLLRSASGITSPIDAWHVKHLELWGPRWDWTEWRPWSLRKTAEQAGAPRQRRRHAFEKAPCLEWVIPRWELAHYLKIMREELGLPENVVDLARVEFQRGCDSVMQMLLIVLCPQLESLKFMYNRYDEVESRRGLHWLTFVMGKSWLDSSWPLGLQSLRDVAVGLTSKTCLDDDMGYLCYPCSYFTGLMKLPNLRSLYFEGLRPRDRPEIDGEDVVAANRHLGDDRALEPSTTISLRDAADALPARCSSVENLYLKDRCDYVNTVELAAAPRALKSYTIHVGLLSSYQVNKQLKFMVQEQRESLESIMIYDAAKFLGYSCTLYELGRGISVSECTNLRQIHVERIDFLTCAYYIFPWSDGEIQEVVEVWEDASKHQDCAEAIAGYLPPSLEVLILGNSAGITSMEMEEDILMRIILSNKLPCLKAIFIELPDDGGEIYSLAKLYEVGWEKGVDIRVKTNPQGPRHQIQLPMAPQAISHQPRQNAQQSEFDPFKGCWIEGLGETQVEEQTGDVSVDDVFEALDEEVETDDDCPDLHRQYDG